MKKLLLTSAGFLNPRLGEEFLKLVGKNPADIRVLFIPTASEYKLENKDGMFYVKESEKELINIGVLKEHIFWLNMGDISKAGQISSYDVMYVCGGNTFYLMSKLKGAGFDKKIIEFIDSGKVYVGVSAGSVIAGPDISIAGPFDPNDVGLEDMEGLDLTDKIICPHYHISEENIISKFEEKHSKVVLRLKDNQALEVLGDNSNIIE